MSGAGGAHSHLAGIVLAILAVACFATLDTTTKLVSASVPILLAIWFRYCVQAVATTLVMAPRRGWGIWRTRQPGLQLLRGVLLIASSAMAFLSLKYLPVAEFTAIVSLSPLVITLVAATVLRVPVSLLRWLLVIGGFMGAVIIIRPGHDQFSWATLLPLAVLGTNTTFQLLTSHMVKTEDPLTMHLYTGWVGMLLSALALPWVWETLSATEWALLLLMGLTGTLGHFLLILAYSRAPVTTLGPFLYAQIAFAVAGGWIVFSHTPDGWSLLGMCVIALCGAGAAWLTMQENRSLRPALVPPAQL